MKAISRNVPLEKFYSQLPDNYNLAERELIDRALRETHGNVTHAARLLKISRKGLQLKMKELGLRDTEPPPGAPPTGSAPQ